MPFFEMPEFQIAPGDDLDTAELKLRSAFEEAEIDFSGMAWVNSRLPKTIADVCRFFWSRVGKEMFFTVLSVGNWQEQETLSILNIVLGLRLDPRQPGRDFCLRYYSLAEVPPELLMISGDTALSEFEARACLVARFGEDLRPQDCQQLAASGMYLARSLLGAEVDLLAPEAPSRLAEALCDRLDAEKLPVEEPLNLVILLGCLFGEMVRNRVKLESSWMALRQIELWPAVVFSRKKATGSDSIVFSPMDHLRGLVGSRDRDALRRAIEELKTVCG